MNGLRPPIVRQAVQQNPTKIITHREVTAVRAESALGRVAERGCGSREVAENGLGREMDQPKRRTRGVRFCFVLFSVFFYHTSQRSFFPLTRRP